MNDEFHVKKDISNRKNKFVYTKGR